MRSLVLTTLMFSSATSGAQNQALPLEIDGPHLRFAYTCGRALRAARRRAAPRLDRATRPLRDAVDHSLALAFSGSFEDRLSHNQRELLATNFHADGPAAAMSVVLNRGFGAVDPDHARDFRIVVRDEPLTLFRERDVKPTLYPPGTPLLVRQVHPVVHGVVSTQLLRQIVEHARGSRK